jgi:hypothetical protein
VLGKGTHHQGLRLGVLTDRIIFDFIRDLIRKIMKIIRSVSVSEIFLRMRIRYDPYLFVSDRLDIIHQYPTLSKGIRSDIIRICIRNIFIICF